MAPLRNYRTGERIPGSQHSVIVSLPALADVIGYEERRPETMRAVRTGYPRFLRHPFVNDTAEKFAAKIGLVDREIFPVASTKDALRVANFAGAINYGIAENDGWVLLHLPKNDTANVARAAKIIQHTGVGISSRQAEDFLVKHGFRDAIEPGEIHAGNDALSLVQKTLAPYLAPVPFHEIKICRAGMNAVYAAFEAVRAVQRPRKRRLWLQLGWLYVDTTSILQNCLRAGEKFAVIDDVLDKEKIGRFFEENGGEIAGVITEAPTNPLMQTCDLKWLSALVHKHNALLILDPSISGIVNVNALPFADILATSLTKYAAHEGDIMLGALAVNPDSADFAVLSDAANDTVSPPYKRDVQRLAAQISKMAPVSFKVNQNTIRLAEWLERQPAVRRVHWANSPRTAENYFFIARDWLSPGCMISIELNGDLETFYDNFHAAKGPSFGTSFTLISPFIYLAHYDLLATPESRETLRRRGINPELIRISVGAENYADIEETFTFAFEKMMEKK